MKLSESYIRRIIREELSQGVLDKSIRPINKIKKISDEISDFNLQTPLDEESKKIEEIIPLLTKKEIIEMYECDGGRPGTVSISGGIGNEYSGYKKTMNHGKVLEKIGLVINHDTKKKDLEGGSIETAIGWYLTQAGDKVIGYIVDEFYDPYVLKEIQKNKYLKKNVESVSGVGDGEFIVRMKKGNNPHGIWFNAKTKKIDNIDISAHVGEMMSLDSLNNALKKLIEGIKNTNKLQEEFKKLELKSFEEVYQHKEGN